MKEKKEKITLPPLKEIKEEEEHVNNIAENNENNNKSLFGNLPITNTEKDKKEEKDNYNPTSLFSGSTLFNDVKGSNNNISLFGNNNEEKNDNKTKINLFGKLEEKPDNEIKEEKKEKLNFSFFNNNNPPDNNNIPSVFGNNDKDNNIKTNEEPKSNFSSKAAGSLATTSNPFLNPSTSNIVPSVFNAEPLLNSNKKENNNNGSLFKVGLNNSLFNNNINEQKIPIINNQGMGMNNGGMDMSPNLQPRNLYNNFQSNNNNSLFSTTNNLNSSGINILCAPTINNGNSLFNNNIFQQQQNSGGIFGQGSLFSGNNPNSSFSGFSLGKKS